MLRKIIHIDAHKCNSCGLCVQACHEGAIHMVDGKAALLRDDYCDGLGDCLPACPTGAITFETREAAPYDDAAVAQNMAKKNPQPVSLPCGCPGSHARKLTPHPYSHATALSVAGNTVGSQLRQWPVQIQLAPVNADFFNGAHLLIAADCAAYAYNHFHNDFMHGKITLIGCPKLDNTDYATKLSAIMANNAIASVTLVRMEVPCCGGLEAAVNKALANSEKPLPLCVVTLTTDGRLLEA